MSVLSVDSSPVLAVGDEEDHSELSAYWQGDQAWMEDPVSVAELGTKVNERMLPFTNEEFVAFRALASSDEAALGTTED